jgi:hypothetical protein
MVAYPIEIIENGERLRLQWDTRRVCTKKDAFWGMVSVVTLWTAVTMLVTYAIFQPGAEIGVRIFCALWCIWGWGITFVVIYVLAQWFWTEWIEVSREFFSHGTIGLFSGQPKTLPLDSIDEIGIYRRFGLTISYKESGRRRFRLIGRWLSREMDKYIFQVIEDFVARKHIRLRMARSGS